MRNCILFLDYWLFFLLECCSKCLYHHVDGGSEACLGFVDSDGRAGAGFWLHLCTDSDYFGKFECFGCGFSGVPCLLLVLVSVFMFWGRKYRSVSPAVRCVRFSLTKNILGLGGQFFVIMISMLFIFQFVNIILSRVEGPEAVTQYNIVYKYFSVFNMMFVIVLTPFGLLLQMRM